ncbi:MAG: GAF domain-containing protein, partial [Cyanobacteriota bacterium]
MGQPRTSKTYETQVVSLARVLQILREEENVDVLIETTLDYLRREFDYRLIWIAFYDRLEHRLVGKGGITPEGDSSLLKQRFFIHPGDVMEQLIIQQRPIGIADLRQEVRAGEWRKAAQQFDIQGTLLFPLRCKDRCFGISLLGSHLWGISPRAADKAQLSMLFGALATALYQIEVEWQRSSTKRPDQPLFEVINEVQQSPSLELRLEKVVALTQQFVAPTRTNLYWYSPEQRFFWHRMGNRQIVRSLGNFRNNAPGIKVNEAYDFYQILAEGDLVAIGAGRSPLKAESTAKLLSRLRIRSLLAAPIIVHEELVGFLSVEDNEARIWEEAEKNYVRAVAQTVAMVARHEDIEAELAQAKSDTSLAGELASKLTENSDLETGLRSCAQLVTKRFDLEGLLVFEEKKVSSTTGKQIQYDLFYQYSALNRRPAMPMLPPLTEEQWQKYQQGSSVIAIDDLQEDDRLKEWREALLGMEVRSLLVSRISHELTTGIVLLTHNSPRTWAASECRLMAVVAQQMGWLLKLQARQGQLQCLSAQQDILKDGLRKLWENQTNLSQLEPTWLEYLCQLLQAKLAVLLHWESGDGTNQSQAKVTAIAGEASLAPNLTLSVVNEPLIQSALAVDGFYAGTVEEVGKESLTWLNTPNLDKVLVSALRSSPDTSSTGVIVLGFEKAQSWPSHLLDPLEILIRQLAWVNRSQGQISTPTGGQSSSEASLLNWYKHRALGILHQSIADSFGALLVLEMSLSKGDVTNERSLRQMRQGQLLRQLENTMTLIIPVLTEEQDQLMPRFSSIPLTHMLKRGLRLVESQVKQRQLWTKIHNTGKFNIYSDRIKLECVLFEVLTHACDRSPNRSQIDFWCRPLILRGEAAAQPTSRVELSIVESHVSSEGNGTSPEPPWKVPCSPLEPDSMNLIFCQQLFRQLRGNLQFFKLKDGRYLTRLILPWDRTVPKNLPDS